MLIIGVFALLVVLYSLVAGRLEGTPITAPMVFVTAGIVAVAAGALDSPLDVTTAETASGAGAVTIELSSHAFLVALEVTLALLLFSDAARIPLRTLRGNAALPGRLLLIGLPLTVALTGAAAYGLFNNELVFWEALVLATVVAPTDAALGQSVVSNPRLPVRVRQALNVESGLNDGLAVPLFTVFLTLAVAEEEVTAQSAGRVIVEKLGYGILVGVGVGLIGGWLVTEASKRGWMTGVSQQLGIASMALFAWWSAEEIGGSGFIAAFVGGVAVGYAARWVGPKVVEFTEDIGTLLNLFVFFGFGLVAIELLRAATWEAVLFAVLALTLLRMVPVAVSMVGTGLRPLTVGFLGWFGPRGLASIILALLVIEEEPELAGGATIVIAMAVTVVLSVYAHGLTAAPGVAWYSRRAEGLYKEAPEKHPVPELPTRIETSAGRRGSPAMPGEAGVDADAEGG
jgi:NhaP-type Na+/H+ or K+/H+ antiporter